MSTEPAWHADPMGRFASRWWDGTTWTDHVADAAGVATTDAVAVAPADTTAMATAEAPAAGDSSPPAAPFSGPPKHKAPNALLVAGAAVVVVLAIMAVGAISGSGSGSGSGGAGSGPVTIDNVDVGVLREQLPVGLEQLDFEMSTGAVDITPSTGEGICTNAQTGLDQYLALGSGFPGDMADPWDRSVDAYTRAVSSCQDGDVEAMVAAMTEGRQATDEFLVAVDEQCEMDTDPFYLVCT